MAVNTWDGAVSTDYNDADNWNTTGETDRVPTSADDVIIPDTSSINNCALSATGGNPKNVNSFKIEANGTIIGNDIAIRVYGENGSGFAVDNDGIISGDLHLIIKTAATTTCDFNGTSGNFKNVEIDHSSCDATFHTDTTFDGTLTITAGTLKPQGGSTITVAGDTSVTGTFGVASGSGSHSFGSLTINSGGTHIATSGTTTITNEISGAFALDKHSSGTFTHNSGTVEVTTNTNTFIDGFEGTVTSGSGANALNNLIVNLSDSASYHFRLRPNSGTAHTILGNLTVTQGMFELETDSHTLTVNGDVSVGANGTLGRLAKTGNDSFGSLTIASGGTYNATSGTTTITNRSGDFAWKNDGGTFTHNSGTVKLDTNTGNTDIHVDVKENIFYNFEMDMNATSHEVKLQDTSGNAVTILNNLTVTQGIFQSETASDTYTINGLTKIKSGGTFMGDANHDTNKIIHNGLVTNEGTYKINDGTTVKMNGGIRNLGTITVA